MAVLTERKTEGDIVRHEYRNDYCEAKGGGTVYNRSNAALTINDAMGYPVIADESVAGAFQFAAAGEEANVIGVMLHAKKIDAIADNATVKCRVLVRGPAVVDKVQLPTVDYAAAAFTLATIVSALEALNPPILASGESPVTHTQST